MSLSSNPALAREIDTHPPHPVRAAGRHIVAAELPLLLLVSPALLFPRGPLPVAGLIAILLLWLARLAGYRRVTLSTPLDLPMLLLLVMSLQALYPSIDRALSMPKLYGVVLGVAVYYGVVNQVTDRRRWWMGIAVLLLASVGVAAVGLVSTDWITEKLPRGAALYARIPRLVQSVHSSSGPIAGIQPNELGGTLAFLLPVALGLSLGGGGTRDIGRGALLRLAAAVTLLVAGSVLVLSQSRSSLLGFGVAAALLIGLRWRRLGFLMLAAAVAGAAFATTIGLDALSRWLLQLDYVGDASWKFANRQEIWSRALYMIQDFPFTGVGLNSFGPVLMRLYPSASIGSVADVPHAHNIYLQAAVDLGLAGSMALVGICVSTLWMAVRVFRRAEEAMGNAAVALGAGLVAYMVYGLTDAITLGAKPLPLLWAMVGLIAAADRLVARTKEGPSPGDAQGPSRGPSPRGIRAVAREIGTTARMLYWSVAILFALMAYAVVGMAISGWMP